MPDVIQSRDSCPNHYNCRDLAASGCFGENRMKWLDRIPFTLIVPLAVFLTFAPFVPEPHLWEKLRMLSEGNLTRPIDIFDLIMHAAPLILLVAKLARISRQAR